MTISGWVACIIMSILIAGVGGYSIYSETENVALTVIAALVVIIIIFGVGFWYYGNTASGIRAITDQQAELQNGLNRILTVYAADGTVLKQYEGKFDIVNGYGSVKFDWNGKRYIYYNCYVETIADIK